jgi:hypothetical protein
MSKQYVVRVLEPLNEQDLHNAGAIHKKWVVEPWNGNRDGVIFGPDTEQRIMLAHNTLVEYTTKFAVA